MFDICQKWAVSKLPIEISIQNCILFLTRTSSEFGKPAKKQREDWKENTYIDEIKEIEMKKRK